MAGRVLECGVGSWWASRQQNKEGRGDSNVATREDDSGLGQIYNMGMETDKHRGLGKRGVETDGLVEGYEGFAKWRG